MIGERILLMLSRNPKDLDYVASKGEYSIDNALDLLTLAFGSEFCKDIAGKTILDFGCGWGYQVIAMALKGASFVVGVDVREEFCSQGIKLAREFGVYQKVEFITKIEDNLYEHFDLIISQNSFEHYGDPHGVMILWKKILKPKGKIYIVFGPPWYAPYGSHMHFFTKIPWLNLLFRESTVMKVRSHFRSDGAKRYEEVEGGLNKMSINKFEQIIREPGLRIRYINYHAVKGIRFLTKLPYLRELFVNHVGCILVKEY